MATKHNKDHANNKEQSHTNDQAKTDMAAATQTNVNEMQPSRGDTAPVPYRSGAMGPFGMMEPFRRMREQFDRMFDQFFRGWPTMWEGEGREWNWNWGMDVHEDDANLVVRAEAPGFEPDDFDLQVRGDQLVLRATHKAEKTEKEGGYHEWRQHEFYRAVPLPSGVDADKVEAKYRNGVLTVTMPKTEASKGRRITVQS